MILPIYRGSIKREIMIGEIEILFLLLLLLSSSSIISHTHTRTRLHAHHLFCVFTVSYWWLLKEAVIRMTRRFIFLFLCEFFNFTKSSSHTYWYQFDDINALWLISSSPNENFNYFRNTRSFVTIIYFYCCVWERERREGKSCWDGHNECLTFHCYRRFMV